MCRSSCSVFTKSYKRDPFLLTLTVLNSVKMNLIYDTFQCISTIAFVKNEGEVLDSPIWIMLINIVALEMLGAKMPKPTGLYWYFNSSYYAAEDVNISCLVSRQLWLMLHNVNLIPQSTGCPIKLPNIQPI